MIDKLKVNSSNIKSINIDGARVCDLVIGRDLVKKVDLKI